MSSTFSFNRLGKLVRKHGVENARFYLMTILAILGVQALILIFWIAFTGPNYHEEPTYIFYLFGLAICGSIFASISLSMLGDKAKAIYWLSLPASHAEKLVTIIFYSTIVFFVVYSAGYFLLREGAIYYAKMRPGATYSTLNWHRGFGKAIPVLLYAYFAMQAWYLMGSAYFSRFSFVRSTILGAGIIFLFLFFNKSVSDAIFPTGYFWNVMEVRTFPADGGMHVYSLSQGAQHIMVWIFKLIWAPVFWVITWYRLKEKEI